MLPVLTKVEAQAVTAITGGGAMGTSAYTLLADITVYMQLASAVISVALGLYAIYRIYKNYEK